MAHVDIVGMGMTADDLTPAHRAVPTKHPYRSPPL